MAKSRNTERKSNKNKVEYSFEVTRAYEFKSGDITFDMIVNGVSIYGCFIRENKKGEKFIAFPSHKGSDGKYYSYAYFPIDDDLIDDIIDAVDDKLG